jgi:subtilisin family serine protease
MVMVGIMPDSDQWQNTGVTDFLDGMNYVYTYAAAQGKPAVVNLSWGSPVGPHDGTSLFSQACDALTGRGKIFVCAAGNEGDTKVHLHKLFTSTDSVVNTFVTFQPGMNPKNTWVDVWGEQGKTFCAQVSLYHDTLVTSTGYVCLDNTIHEFYLVGTNHDTCYVTLTTSTSEFNGKPRIYLSIGSKVTDSICLSIKSFDGEIHAWNGYVRAGEGYFGDLTDFGKPWATPGDVYYSITDIASTHSAITAGAYAAKTTYRSIGGGTYVFNSYDAKLHDLAPFSSRGPGVDGTIKPDITAPGICVVSSVNSNDASFKLGGSNYTSVVSVSHNAISNKNYYYAQLSGTSMATPATSGIIALMLQANHNMNPDEIKTILAQTAITDTFTGNIPAQGNTNWGHGKINAYSAVIAASALATGNDNLVTNDLHCNLYPNPNNGFFSIEYNADKNETLQIDVYDITGKVITTDTWAVNPGYNKKRMLLRSYEGLYFVKISSAQNRYSLLKNLIIR